ncbi:hypothetical protein HZF05_16620 [Sphingomonas sp. CGMCC 1.13654]|uniref:Uncharacterized protein n=1 Tax=Sphingomonas chungangi TaxID=2683589 RepID=A0A838LAU0_9SPHN|nr:hypothetical protein [Sphingomonas chungangi]MBA2935709.1 hypothetical protein [Sphingomonas chungangi]MVW54399.1 hypothetical protein [Sphingomonas chungangi]
MLMLMAALQAMALGPAPAPHAPAVPDDPRYASCAGAPDMLAKGSHLSWKLPSSDIKGHRKLRDALRASPPPETGPRILWFANGGDLATTTFSVVATRDSAGWWRVDGVGSTRVWIADAKPTIMPTIGRTLSEAESREIDALIADPCLTAQPTFVDDPRIAAGGLYHQLEIEGAGHDWRGGWHGMPTVIEDRITTILGKH